MGTVRPPDIVLAYLKHIQKGTKQEIVEGINSLIKVIVPKGVYSAIDFTFYHDRITSDVTDNILWGFLSSDIITKQRNEHDSEVIYSMTEYGNKIVDYLLQSFKESDDYEKVRGSFGMTK